MSILYFVTPILKTERQYLKLIENVVKADVDWIQLRIKSMPYREILSISDKVRNIIPRSKRFILNDYVDIAFLCNADGVHLGQKDIPVVAAKKLCNGLKRKLIIGKSTHSLKEVISAIKEKPDYISIGPIFTSSTKPEYTPIGIIGLRNILLKISSGISLFTIGGISLYNVKTIVSLGIRNIALSESIYKARNINTTVKRLKEILNT